ncbi:MAG: ribosome small subunit-dependent GTPase A [Mycoplasmatota bacterium]
MNGIIIKSISNDYTVLVDKKTYICKPRGLFRKQNISPLVGDNVVIDEKNNYILEIKKRKNHLVRPPIANVDQAIIVMSAKEPDFSTNLLDKLLCVIEYNNILPIICITKLDLLNKEEQIKINNYINYYKSIGYQVFRNDKTEEMKTIFKNKISVFTGQSGAGKSTLLNKLNIELNIKTNEISKALGRGKHTTRHVELLNVLDGMIADTPGFSSIDLNTLTNQDIRDNFIEFNQYKEECKYRDCMHHLDDSCKIKQLVEENIILKERYEDYIKFITRGE